MPEPQVHQITNYEFDERFYQHTFGEGDEERVAYAPSVTYVLHTILKDGSGLERWRGDVGNRRADEIIEEAGEEGSFTHEAIERLLLGEKVPSDEARERFNPRRSLRVLRYLDRFQRWYEYWQPEVLETEYISWHPDFSYAGTVDLKCKIDASIPQRRKIALLEESEKKLTKAQQELSDRINAISVEDTTRTMLVDIKTSNNVWLSHRLQIAAYLKAEDDCDTAAILHLDAATKTTDPTKGTIAGTSFLVMDEEERVRRTEQWNHCLDLFKVLHPNAKPTEETFPEDFDLGIAEDIAQEAEDALA